MPTRVILTRDIISKRKVTLVGGDNPAQPIYILDDYIDDYYLSHGPYAPILHKCIDLARRFVFSEPGMRMAAQALVESWTAGCAIASSANKQQLEKLYAEAAYQVQRFGQHQSMRIVVESRVYRGVHVLCAEPSTVWLSSSVGVAENLIVIIVDDQLAQQAAEAESRYLDEGPLSKLVSNVINMSSTSPFSSPTVCSKPCEALRKWYVKQDAFLLSDRLIALALNI